MERTASNKTNIVVGILTMLLGCIPLLAMSGVLPRGNEPADPAPAWMGWIIGAMFVGAGLIVIMRGMVNVSDSATELPTSASAGLRLMYDTMSVGIVCGLAMLFSWVAFGPGARHFTVNIGGLFVRTSGSGDNVGRIAFGFGAVAIWCVTAAMAMQVLRKWQRPRA